MFADHYPQFPDSNIGVYKLLARPEHQERLDHDYSFEVINPQPHKVVLASSLFAKPPDQELDPISIPEDLDRLHPSIRRGEATWNESFLNRFHIACDKLDRMRCGWGRRIYLARDLEHLIDELVGRGAEVRLMRSSSVLHNPGACWRFMAADDTEIFFARDIEDMAPTDFERRHMNNFINEARRKGKPMMYRMIYNWDYDDEATVYRPASANFVGGYNVHSWGLTEALKAWDWFGSAEVPEGEPRRARSRFLPSNHLHPVRGVKPLFGMRWPRYGGDEQFAGQWMYWKAVKSKALYTTVGTSEEGFHIMLVEDLANVLEHDPDATIHAPYKLV